MENIQLTGDNKPCINQSLCLYYKVVVYESVQRIGNILANYVSNENIKWKLRDNGCFLKLS